MGMAMHIKLFSSVIELSLCFLTYTPTCHLHIRELTWLNYFLPLGGTKLMNVLGALGICEVMLRVYMEPRDMRTWLTDVICKQ